MKTRLALLGFLLALAPSVTGQQTCRQADSTVVARRLGVTIRSVSLPTGRGYVRATAAIPGDGTPGDPIVFSFSTLVSPTARTRVDITELACQMAADGQPNIVIERQLTWPEIHRSVGHLQVGVICAEQWLSRHAAVRPNHWRFIGPATDTPTSDRFDELGDRTSMTFWVVFPIADAGDDAKINTENLLRDVSTLRKWLLKPFIN